MTQNNRPRSRERNVTGQGKGVTRRSTGSSSSHTGSSHSSSHTGTSHTAPSHTSPPSSGFTHRPSTPPEPPRRTTRSSYTYQTPGGYRSGSKSRRLIFLIILLLVVYFLFRSSSGGSGTTGNISFSGNSSVSTGWNTENTSGTLNTSVAEGTRDKYTSILGDGSDQITIMVYMCGTDLESKNGMATSDLVEMTNATLDTNLNLIVYTGGCTQWNNNVVSSSTNQIYQIRDGGIALLNADAGNVSMTNPDTLSSFIRWTAENYPANRYDLILWDHGGGSVSGYGYDEKFKSSGSMSLSGIRDALQDSGIRFDFIGFDACLMATMENALMLSSYADYLIASEETEPGIGWYYTNWLTALSANTSMATVETGKNIIDDFVTQCNTQCSGQKTTLSIIDLAELSNTAPSKFSSFSRSITDYINNKEYTTVSDARNQTREFASSSKIDQVDLIHFAENLGNEEGKQLSEVLRSAIKYNRTSANMTNAYGLAIYFPMRSSTYVDSMTKTYDAIDMDDDYTSCVRAFASVQASAQAANGGTGSPYNSLFSEFAGSFSGLSSSDTEELISSLLNAFLSGNRSMVSGLTDDNTEFMRALPYSEEELREYISENHFDANNLTWVTEDGQEKIKLSESQWQMVSGLELNVFYDDGSGYIDMGLDNVYDFDDEGNLIADEGTTWLSINDQPVSYYHIDTVDDGTNYTITGRVPCELNGDRAELILVFTDEIPYGYIAGAVYDYSSDSDIETIAKNMTSLNNGDTLDFLCDYYAYDGTYQSSYYLGDTMTVTDNMVISDTYLNGPVLVTYRFTDQFNNEYWTETINRN